MNHNVRNQDVTYGLLRHSAEANDVYVCKRMMVITTSTVPLTSPKVTR